jgi:hypothetical protein
MTTVGTQDSTFGVSGGKKMKSWFVPFLLVLSSCGCTSLALEKHTIGQVQTTTDLRYQEVLDNLALLNDNPCSLPAFAVMLSGTTKILDQAQTISSTLIGRETVGKAGATITHFQQQLMDLPAQRGINENWTLDPVTSPEKLVAIRAACHWVLFGETSVVETGNVHLGARPKPDDLPSLNDPSKRGYYFNVADDLAKLPKGWLCHGALKDVPWNAAYKAGVNGKWVWVMPNGMEGLSGFTIVIQTLSRQVTDKAYYPPPVVRTINYSASMMMKNGQAAADKSVLITAFVDQNGIPVSDANSYAYPVKQRLETIVNDPNLKSQIAASSSGH